MLAFLEKFGVNTTYIIAAFGIVMCIVAFSMLDVGSNQVVRYALITAPVWLPVITFYFFFEYWLMFVRKQFNLAQGRTTIEIKLPQDIFKSPEAMELVLSQLHQTAGPDNHVQTYWDGKNPPTHSLELVSRGGDVRFYINTPKKKFKNMFETQLYAQYPGIEVTELDIDYTAEIPWDPSRFDYFSFHIGAKKPDAYPIKTYIEYGLDKMPKEEEKIDPISALLEVLGSIGPGEHMWVQILISANRKTDFKTGYLTETPDWKTPAQAEIKKIIENANMRIGIKPDPERGMTYNMMSLSDGEKETVKAIERSLGKNAYNTTIRAMYIAEKKASKLGERLGGLTSAWRTYDDVNRNSIGVTWRTDVDWPWWQDPSGAGRLGMKQAELNEYKRRAYNNYSSADVPKVFTTEELATMYHLPGKVIATPTLARIPSKRAEAPPNLPVGS